MSQQVKWLTVPQQTAWRNYLFGSTRLHQRLDAELRDHNLSIAEYEILVQLSEAPERRMRMSDLAAEVLQSRSRVTHTVNRLESRALVRREGCPTDRRGVWAQLTDLGLELLVAAAPDHVRSVREHIIDVLTPAELIVIGKAFGRVVERLGKRQ